MLRVAIVGAGPAGSSAGYHLAVRGFPVTLADRCDFPRDKVCGDWLPPNALDELARLGMDAAALDALAPDRARVQASAITAPGGGESTHPLSRAACCSTRRR